MLLKDAHDVRGGMPPEIFTRLMTELVELGHRVHELVFGTVAEDQALLATRIARWVKRTRAIDPTGYLIINCDTLQPVGYRRLKDACADAIWTFMEVMTPDASATRAVAPLMGSRSPRPPYRRPPERVGAAHHRAPTSRQLSRRLGALWGHRLEQHRPFLPADQLRRSTAACPFHRQGLPPTGPASPPRAAHRPLAQPERLCRLPVRPQSPRLQRSHHPQPHHFPPIRIQPTPIPTIDHRRSNEQATQQFRLNKRAKEPDDGSHPQRVRACTVPGAEGQPATPSIAGA